jgi:hypothetical protein
VSSEVRIFTVAPWNDQVCDTKSVIVGIDPTNWFQGIATRVRRNPNTHGTKRMLAFLV